MLTPAAIAFGDPSRIPFDFGLQSCRTIAIAPVDDVRSDLAFEANTEHLQTDAHALFVRSPVVRNARARFSSSFFFLSFFGGVGDILRAAFLALARARWSRRWAARLARNAASGSTGFAWMPIATRMALTMSRIFIDGALMARQVFARLES